MRKSNENDDCYPLIDTAKAGKLKHYHNFQPFSGVLQGSNGIFIFWCSCGKVIEREVED